MTELRLVFGIKYGTNRSLTFMTFSKAEPTLNTLASSCALPNMNTENLDTINANQQACQRRHLRETWRLCDQAISWVIQNRRFFRIDTQRHTHDRRPCFCCECLQHWRQEWYHEYIAILSIERIRNATSKVLVLLEHCFIYFALWTSRLCSFEACDIADRMLFLGAHLGEVDQVLEVFDVLRVSL